MATTTNYGWAEPDNTSLVKNGAQDIRILGDAIDASVWNIGYGQAGKNKLINGNFDIWQRGTSFTGVLDVYLADRWSATRSGTTINLTVTQDTSVPNTNSKYSMKFQQVTTGASAITEYATRQAIEQTTLLPILGKSCTVSFWYRSNKTGSHGIRIISINTGGTDQATTFTVNAANTWEYKTVAVTAFSAVSAANLSPTAASGYVDIGFRVGGTGAGFTTLAANDYFQISQVQLEYGSKATPFQTASGGSPQAELAMCQRYYWRSGGNIVYQRYGNGSARSTNQIDVVVNFPVTMRTTPSTLDYASIAVYDGSFVTATTAIALDQTSPMFGALLVSVASGLTQFRPYSLLSNNTTSAYLGFSAEL
jgi:hypothetical protein